MTTFVKGSNTAQDDVDKAEADLLRIATAGSVDDGKSTLVGRLLYDSRAVLQDQWEAIEQVRQRRGNADVDLALLTDGLRAEREQGITIDVAYRYFSTARRRFIVADTPGHVHYTRNMVTGASTAHVAIVLVDASKGIITQSRRHSFVSALLRIPHIVVAVNKMDLVGYSQASFAAIVDEFRGFARRLAVESLTFIPVSALKGDNVVQRSERLAWYHGPCLLECLEQIPLWDRHAIDAQPLRLPVQMVVRPANGQRGISGQIACGRVAVGDEITILPARRVSGVTGVVLAGDAAAVAVAGDSIVLTLADDIDVGRGDLIVRRGEEPAIGSRLECILCWLDEAPLDPRLTYLLRHTTREVAARVERIRCRIDVDTFAEQPAATFALNEIGVAEVVVAQPLAFDAYEKNRTTGSFILIDPRTHNTVAAGLIRGAAAPSSASVPAPAASPPRDGPAPAPAHSASPRDIVWDGGGVERAAREARNGHAAAVLWFTGLSGAGKSTLARALEARLFSLGVQTIRLDGDNLRHGLNTDLGFGDDDRRENIRRVGHLARLAYDHGMIALCALISPFRAEREEARALLPDGCFLEVYVRCDIEECRRRDPKGLYARADRGEIARFTGISSPYEEPDAPEVILDTSAAQPAELVDRVIEELRRRGLIADP